MVCDHYMIDSERDRLFNIDGLFSPLTCVVSTPPACFGLGSVLGAA